ncbi:glucose-6-phosphate isomerase [Cobetia amphilecti]|uniref:Glucose-6-phosphate isomerase n=2 Tax=Cobetia TaxID=204286 RepID=A0AAP4WWI2_9GAMM|nr:glucose-6-phosphate isomerase [Cobetia amphilecti]MDO6671197.1 glucose-6-phosphate isomerase [Cobetia amphilecti]
MSTQSAARSARRNTQAWQALARHHQEQMADVHLKDLFAEDAAQGRDRVATFTRSAAGLRLDLSKQRLKGETLELLLDLARETGVEQGIKRLLAGEHVNRSEDRPALHAALRLPRSASLEVNGEDIVPAIHESLEHLAEMVDTFHSGQWRGATGKPITDVVNLGVGGSDLGPLMVSSALSDCRPKDIHEIGVHFASTMDGSQLADYLESFSPETTLFILSSKSFSTIDTLSNARTARDWLKSRLDPEGRLEALINRQHFIGASAKPEKMTEWGIAPEHQLLFWDWVGGRYSLWGTIGLPIALNVGMDNFRRLLAGAHELDEHFRTAPLEDNLPVLLALAGIWNNNFLDIRAHSILPYDGRLEYFASYLEQLEMESNGKSVTNDGEMIDYSTCPVLWGQLGPNAQHAFYQLLHQGTQAVECDFIAPMCRYDHVEDAETRAHLKAQHRLTLANCFAQSRVLMLGDDAIPGDEAQPNHKRYRGNQPSTTLLLETLTPETLGALIALYEQKVFVQATIWDINPFDQWGVELGKQIATATEATMTTGEGFETLDASSRALIEAVWAAQDQDPR